MKVKDGTVPHYVKVQMGALPDAARDGRATLHIPLDESAEGIGLQLARLARIIENTDGVA